MALAKTVVIHETGEVFQSMTEAADGLGVNVASLSCHINEKRILKCLEGLTLYTVKKKYVCGKCGTDLVLSNWSPSLRKGGCQLCRDCHIKEGYKSKNRDPLRKRNSTGIGMKGLRSLVEKYPSCPLCGFVFENLNFEIDHDMPVSRGGSNSIENLQLLCHRCNKGKDALTTEEYIDHCRRVVM